MEKILFKQIPGVGLCKAYVFYLARPGDYDTWGILITVISQNLTVSFHDASDLQYPGYKYCKLTKKQWCAITGWASGLARKYNLWVMQK